MIIRFRYSQDGTDCHNYNGKLTTAVHADLAHVFVQAYHMIMIHSFIKQGLRLTPPRNR